MGPTRTVWRGTAVDMHCATATMKQTTIKRSVGASGTGLHTGAPVNIALKPAPENTGYVFIRTDLDNFEIPASVEYISHCSYATTLLKSGVVLSTCEHLLSALRGCGVDNCFIEIDTVSYTHLRAHETPEHL